MRTFALSALLIAGCTTSEDVKDWQGYGVGQPGFGLVHGGQVFYELIHAPNGDIAQINGWARTFSPDPEPAATVPIPKIPPMTCQDISTAVFPRPPAEGSNFVDLGAEITLTTGSQVLRAPQTANFVDNLQFGIPMGYQLQPFDPLTVVHEAVYEVAFNGSDKLTPNTMFFSPIFTINSPPIGKAPVQFTHGQGLDISWDPVNQVTTAYQKPDQTFPFVIILSMPSPTTGQTKWFCPMNDGQIHDSFTIPPEVVDALPPAGILVMGQQTHMQAAFESPDGVKRRFDLITIECNRSPFSFTP